MFHDKNWWEKFNDIRYSLPCQNKLCHQLGKYSRNYCVFQRSLCLTCAAQWSRYPTALYLQYITSKPRGSFAHWSALYDRLCFVISSANKFSFLWILDETFIVLELRVRYRLEHEKINFISNQPSISKDFPNVFQMLPTFPNICRRFPKIIEIFWRFPRKIRR